MTGLIFDGFDTTRRAILYRGGLGGHYAFSPAGAGDFFHFPHGSRLRFRRGPHAASGVLVAVGVTTGHRHELVAHDESAGVAFIVVEAFSFNELCEKHDPVPVPPSEALQGFATQDVEGPLGYTYTLNTDPSYLGAKYGVAPGTEFTISTHGAKCVRVVGEFLSVLWVVALRRGAGSAPDGTAFPLVGCTDEAKLLHLHGARESDGVPRTPRTPGCSARKRAQCSIDDARKVVRCLGPFGSNIELSIADDVMAPFALQHGTRMVSLKGLDAGKWFTVLGVKGGTLYALGDGDAKATCIRNCVDRTELDALFAVEDSDTTLASPRSEGKETPRKDQVKRMCWTVHGRLALNTHCAPFGYNHGQTLKATRGGEINKRFHVFGVRNGVLWVVPDDAEYAVPLLHCPSRAHLDEVHGFVVDGYADLTWLYHAPKPVTTPITSPRGSEEPRTAPSPKSDAQSPHAPSRAPVVIPKLALNTLNVNPEPRDARVDDGAPFVVGTMPATRHFLKAFALSHLNVTSEAQDPQGFHRYYMEAPLYRLSKAIEVLPAFEAYWRAHESELRKCSFRHASTDEMLDVLRRVPHAWGAIAPRQ